ncbi:MAG: YheU family protein [Myxococcota bacterium]
MEIPPDRLPPDVLTRVIEEFVTREGTDYGHGEWSLEQKVADVRRMLRRGEAKLTFDPETETVNIVPANTQA